MDILEALAANARKQFAKYQPIDVSSVPAGTDEQVLAALRNLQLHAYADPRYSNVGGNYRSGGLDVELNADLGSNPYIDMNAKYGKSFGPAGLEVGLQAGGAPGDVNLTGAQLRALLNLKRLGQLSAGVEAQPEPRYKIGWRRSF